jgi:hypothetical protein
MLITGSGPEIHVAIMKALNLLRISNQVKSPRELDSFVGRLLLLLLKEAFERPKSREFLQRDSPYRDSPRRALSALKILGSVECASPFLAR